MLCGNNFGINSRKKRTWPHDLHRSCTSAACIVKLVLQSYYIHPLDDSTKESSDFWWLCSFMAKNYQKFPKQRFRSYIFVLYSKKKGSRKTMKTTTKMKKNNFPNNQTIWLDNKPILNYFDWFTINNLSLGCLKS